MDEFLDVNPMRAIDVMLIHCDRKMLYENLKFISGYCNQPEYDRLRVLIEQRENAIRYEAGVMDGEPITLAHIEKFWTIEIANEANSAARMESVLLSARARQQSVMQKAIDEARALMNKNKAD